MLELMNYDSKWYYTCLRYDSVGRVEYVDRLWRPKGKENDHLDPEWNRFTTQHTYNENGALLSVTDGEDHTWWEAATSDYDELGRPLKFEYGNGLVTTNHFDELTGRLEGSGIVDGIFKEAEYGYQYDSLGNLTQRSISRGTSTLSESCTYDSLNRLLSASVSGTTNYSVSATYNALGNITSRTGVGSYAYTGSRPHAVASATLTSSTNSTVLTYYYDSNGNLVSRFRNSTGEMTASWNSFNKPIEIKSDANTSEFEYSIDGRRTKQLVIDGTNVTKKVYATPAYEIEETLTNPAETNRANWQWEMEFVRVYVDTPVGKIGIYQQEGSTNGTGAVTRSYMHKDHLGSVVAVSDDNGDIEHFSFDAWGNRRDASDWSTLETFNPSTLSTDRGFTGHEQLDHLDLIHMNGRIYDPVIGRFLSPDPIIQAPENLQSFNRYSYVFNNPLTHVDPSGFAAKSQKASSEAATASTPLAENVSSTEISSQDNVGGTSTESSTQVEDYYSDSSGNTQVDQTTEVAPVATAPGDEDIGSTADSGDTSGYGAGTGSETATQQDRKEANPKNANGKVANQQRRETDYNADLRKGYNFLLEGGQDAIKIEISRLRQLKDSDGNPLYKVTIIGDKGQLDARRPAIVEALKTSDLTIVQAHGVEPGHPKYPGRSVIAESGNGKYVMNDATMKRVAARYGNEAVSYGCYSDGNPGSKTSPAKALFDVANHLKNLEGDHGHGIYTVTLAFGYQ